MNANARRRLRQRKYDTGPHRKISKELIPLVDAGLVDCARCRELIEPGTPWDLGHSDRDPSLYSGPEHACCNRTAPHRNNTSRQW